MLSAAESKPQGRPASPHSDSSTLSNITVADPIQPTDTSVAASSTPPTSQSDDMSVHEDAQKQFEQHNARRHSSRARPAVATYNDKENAGTRIHTPAKYRKDKDTPLQSPQHPEHAEQHDDSHETEHDDPSEPPKSPKPDDEPIHRRQSGRARNSVVTYNDKENAGTRIHTPTKYIDGTYIRKTLHDPIPIPGRPPPSPVPANNVNKSVKKRRASGLRTELRADSEFDDDSQAEAQSASPRKAARQAAKASKGSRSLTSQLGKRGRDAFEAVKTKTIGSAKNRSRASESPKKRQKRAASEPTPESAPPDAATQPRRTDLKFGGRYSKPWLNCGKFYNTGQDDLVGALSVIVGHKPKTNADGTPANKTFPLPMFSMAEKLDLYPKKRLPEQKRPFEPFQLPYDIFSPLPKEAKVKDWRELKKSESIPPITCRTRLTSEKMSTKVKTPRRSRLELGTNARSKGRWRLQLATALAGATEIPALMHPSSSNATIGVATLARTVGTASLPICKSDTRTTSAKESTSEALTLALKLWKRLIVVTASGR